MKSAKEEINLLSLEKKRPEILIGKNNNLHLSPQHNLIEPMSIVNSLQEIAISVQNGFKCFGDKPVLHNVNITVREGSIYALLGPSGSGKTTILNCITGLQKLTLGTVQIFGYPPCTREAGVPGPRVGWMPQDIALLGAFTVKETLHYFGTICGMSSKSINARSLFLLKLLNLPLNTSRTVKTLSEGQKRRVSFASSLIYEAAEILILDEPTVGVDPLLRECIWSYLVTLAAEKNVSIIITTHYIEEANRSNMVGVVRNGRIIMEDSPQNLYTKYQIQDLQKIVMELCIQDEKNETDKSSHSHNNGHHHHLQNCSTGSDSGNNFKITKSLMSDDNTIFYPKRPWKARSTLYNRMRALLYKNVMRIFRNIPFLIFFLFVPSFIVIMFGYANGTPLIGLKFGIVPPDGGEDLRNCTINVNQTTISDCSNLFCNLMGRLLDGGTLNLLHAKNESDALEEVHRGQSWGYMVFPHTFSDETLNQQGSKIRIRMDMTRAPVFGMIIKKFYETFTKFTKDVTNDCDGDFHADIEDMLISLETPVYGGLEQTVAEQTMPSVIILVVFYISITLSALVIILEAKEGIFLRSIVSGVSRTEIIVSHLFSQYGIMIVQLVLVFCVAIFWFETPLLGSTALVLIMPIIQGTIGILFGYVLSTICSEESSVLQFANALTIVVIICSGIIWPVNGISFALLRFGTLFSPPNLPAESMKSIMIRGHPFTHPSVYGGFLTSFAWIIWLIICLYILTKYNEQFKRMVGKVLKI